MNNLRHYREKAGMSQEELAKACGLERQASISHYETGRRNPGIKVMHAMIKVFAAKKVRVTMDKLFPPS